MNTLEAIRTRRSIRNYLDKPVSEAMIQKILEAAMQAPSAGNQQPWHFVLVTDRKQLNEMAEALLYGKMLKKAPIGIVVCVDLELEKYPGYWVQDCSNASMNLLLAAHEQGLGAAWVGVYPLDERVAGLKKILGLPESVIPLNVVSLGFPASTPEPAELRYKEDRLHRDRW